MTARQATEEYLGYSATELNAASNSSSLRAAAGKEHQSPNEVSGRVVFVTDATLVLATPVEVTTISHADQLQQVAAGDLLSVVVESARLVAVLGSTSPDLAFPAPDGEYRWYHERERGRHLQLRHRARRAAQRFFDERDYLEVETPFRVPSPGLDIHLDAFPSGERYLITSPEYQMKRLLAAGFPRIVQFARAFRADEEGCHHETEFTMLEWYRAFASSSVLMDETEALVKFVASEAACSHARIAGRTIPIHTEWERATVDELCRRFLGASANELLATGEDSFFEQWITHIEPNLGMERPVFVCEWPSSMASLARLNDNGTADRFEAYVGGLELCNGFGELIDAREQRRRLLRDQDERKRLGLAAYPIDERFLSALSEGLPPCSGNALGFDRLVLLLSGAEHIADVVWLSTTRL